MQLGEQPDLWGLLGYFAASASVVGLMLLASFLIGELRDRPGEQTDEGGAPPTGSAEAPVSARFYLIAMLFLVFDVEAAFILAWTVAVRELGWLGLASIAVFIGVLVAAWFYLWRIGALDWGTTAVLAERRRAVRARVLRAKPETEVTGEVVVEPGR